MRIILVGEAANHRDRLAAKLPFPHRIDTVPAIAPGDSAFKAAADGADALVTLRLPALPSPLEGVRLLQVPGAGLDGIEMGSLSASTPVCNVFEHEGPIAEYVLLAMLHWSVGLDRMRAGFSAGSWASVYRARTPHREIAGQVLGLIGYGRIGRAVAQRAAALGMAVLAVDAMPIADRVAREVFPPARLHEMLRQADFVAVTCPLTPATTGMLGAGQLAAMPAHAVLINVSRAEIVDEWALYDALHSQRIAGAYLDVWYRYPAPGEASVAPASAPFLDLPNVVATPHSSAWTQDLFERRWSVIADNIIRLHGGEPLRNVMRPA